MKDKLETPWAYPLYLLYQPTSGGKLYPVRMLTNLTTPWQHLHPTVRLSSFNSPWSTQI